MTVNLMDDGSIATISVLDLLFEANDVEPRNEVIHAGKVLQR